MRKKKTGTPENRQVFCAAEGRELVMYDSESDSNAGLPPRARYLIMGVRSVKNGPGSLELDVRKVKKKKKRTYVCMCKYACCSME